jgi:hypothetical protein
MATGKNRLRGFCNPATSIGVSPCYNASTELTFFKLVRRADFLSSSDLPVGAM